MKKLLLAALLAGTTAAAVAQDSSAPFTIQETGQGFSTLQDAVYAIGGRQGTILIASGLYHQCAVQDAGRIALVAREPGRAVFDGVACEGKALLVLRGRSAQVQGLTLENINVADGNGAGIRLEQGDLTVTDTVFRDSQSGILSHDDPSATVRIDRSTFSGLGYCGDDCAHSIYLGDYGRLIVTRSRFERGTGGHYVKTRGARVDITDSSFDDSRGEATNYMIDLSNGSTGMITGNTFVQGARKENYSGLIVVAAEGRKHKSAGLVIAGNDASLAPGAKGTTFLVDYSGESLDLEQNRLAPRITRFEER
jgi:hypothetical protein